MVATEEVIPEHETEIVAVGDLRPHPRNYKIHPAVQLEHLAQSIRENGQYRNLVVARDGTILAGHGVFEAIQMVGLDTVKVIRLDLDPEDGPAIKILVADNEVARLAEVDDRRLVELVQDLASIDALLGTGFDQEAVDTLLRIVESTSGTLVPPENEWSGMPGYGQADLQSIFHVTVHFATEENIAEFFERLGVNRHRSFWWPAPDGHVGSDAKEAWVAGEEEPREIERDPRTGLLYRPWTMDINVIRGEDRSYARRLPVEPGERVLDIGGHIGGSAAAFMAAGAALVVAVEPEPDNYELLAQNIPEGALAILAAAVADDRETVTLWRNVRVRGTALHSLTEHRGREGVTVPAVNFSKLIEEHGITYVKMDCEGGEYDLLEPDLGDTVRKLIVEFHANHRSWPPRVPATLDHLFAQGFVPDRDPPTRPTEKAWVWTVAWTR